MNEHKLMQDRVKYEQQRLAQLWSTLSRKLLYQLPLVNEMGWPGNVQLLDTLREVIAVYAQMAALTHLDALTAPLPKQKKTARKRSR